MRLFIAIPLDTDIKQRLKELQDRLIRAGVRASWTKPDQFHLTLKFLGEQPESQIESIRNVLLRAAGTTPAFTIRLERTGCFPDSGSVRVVWVGPNERSQSLLCVAQDIETFSSEIGIAKEKRTFSEHFTIGRVKMDSSHGKLRELVLAEAFGLCVQKVKELVLYQSVLKPSGAEYNVITRQPLNP